MAAHTTRQSMLNEINDYTALQRKYILDAIAQDAGDKATRLSRTLALPHVRDVQHKINLLMVQLQRW